jgi:hypothetical protein
MTHKMVLVYCLPILNSNSLIVKVMKIGGFNCVALIVASVLISAVAATNLQQAYAIDCGSCVEIKKLTDVFEKNVINAIGNTDAEPHLRELLRTYIGDVNRLLGGPDTIPGLVETFDQNVLRLLSAPPDTDKQLVKDFGGLTHDFEKAVLDALSPPPDSTR